MTPSRLAVQLTSVLVATSLHLAPRALQAQADQGALAEELAHGDRAERNRALAAARRLGPDKIGPELRAALITALEREGQSRALRHQTDEPARDPEFMFALSRVVIELRDPRAIPALAGVLGTGLPVTKALVLFGEQALPALIAAVRSPETTPDAVDAALIALRFLAEGAGPRALSTGALEEIRRVADERLNETQSGIGSTLRWAIDLAVTLNDPELRRIVQAIASDVNELANRGMTDAELIALTQQRAADRLAGIPPTPLWQ